MRMLRGIAVGRGERVERLDRVGNPVLPETLRQDLRVARAALLARKAAAGLTRTTLPRRGEPVRRNPDQRDDSHGEQHIVRLSHASTVMCLRASFQLPKLGPGGSSSFPKRTAAR